MFGAQKVNKKHDNYQPPCIITVLKYTGKDAKLFYSNVGLFDYKYALVNYREFCKKLANK